MPRTSLTTTFTQREVLEILARESGIPFDELEIDGIDSDGETFRGISELRVSQTIDERAPAPEPRRVVLCRQCDTNPANDGGDLLCDDCELQNAEEAEAREAADLPPLCKACNQNQVEQVKAGKDPTTGLPKMVSAPHGLCHFCRNPE